MLNPKARALLVEVASQPNFKPMHTMSPEQARRQIDAQTELLPAGPELAVEDVQAKGRAGEIPVRLYHGDDGPRGAIVFFHGGGWVIGNIDSHDAYCRHLAAASGQTVAAVEYRLAPEHRYPAAIDDAYDATRWLHQHQERWGLNGLISVAGDSAGGNLAAAVCLAARDDGGPPLHKQALIYPITDFNLETPSYHAFAEGFQLTRKTMGWFWQHYLTHPSDGEQAFASPLRAQCLSGLPPALVMTAEYDPLRDEGEAYALRLVEAGVIVSSYRAPGMVHGFIRRFDVHPEAMTALDLVAGFLSS